MFVTSVDQDGSSKRVCVEPVTRRADDVPRLAHATFERRRNTHVTAARCDGLVTLWDVQRNVDVSSLQLLVASPNVFFV
jgi:hypothetical protein